MLFVAASQGHIKQMDFKPNATFNSKINQMKQITLHFNIMYDYDDSMNCYETLSAKKNDVTYQVKITD